jgi:hypothetical protein
VELNVSVIIVNVIACILDIITKEYVMSISRELMQWYQMEDDVFLWHVVIVDEMWHNPQPTSKSLGILWRHLTPL